MRVSTDSKGLSNPSEVEALREKVYASLEAYCKQKYPEQPGRYGHNRNGLASTESVQYLCCSLPSGHEWFRIC